MATRSRSRSPKPKLSRGAELLVGWRGERMQIEAAKDFGIAAETYNRLEHGHRRPNLEFAFEIEKITKGAVPAASWQEPPRMRAAS